MFAIYVKADTVERRDIREVFSDTYFVIDLKLFFWLSVETLFIAVYAKRLTLLCSFFLLDSNFNFFISFHLLFHALKSMIMSVTLTTITIFKKLNVIQFEILLIRALPIIKMIAAMSQKKKKPNLYFLFVIHFVILWIA